MTAMAQQLLAESLVKLMRPLVRILLRNGVTYRAFTETAKAVYVEIADNEFAIPGRKQSDSRISVITGLSRKEVKRVKSQGSVPSGDQLTRYNRAARVIKGWTQDAAFQDGRGQPLELRLQDPDAGFEALVRHYSGDAPARAVLDELQQVGAVERTENGTVRLLTRAYLPKTDSPERIGIFGIMAADLLYTCDYNLKCDAAQPVFQRAVTNDRVPVEELEQFQSEVREHGQRLLERFDRWLGEHEAAGTPSRRAGVGLYYFEDPDQ